MEKWTAGYHVVVAKSYEFIKSAKKGTPGIRIVWECVEGACEGNTINSWHYFAGEAAKYSVQSLRNAGWKGDSFKDMTGLGEQKCTIDLQFEKDQEGKDRLRVAWVNKYGAGPQPSANQLEEDDLDKLDAAMITYIQSSEKVDGVAFDGKASFLGSAAEGASDADIPF